MDLSKLAFHYGSIRLHVKSVAGDQVILTRADLASEYKIGDRVFVTVSKAAELVGYTPQTIYQMIRNGELAKHMIDDRATIAVDDLNGLFG